MENKKIQLYCYAIKINKSKEKHKQTWRGKTNYIFKKTKETRNLGPITKENMLIVSIYKENTKIKQ